MNLRILGVFAFLLLFTFLFFGCSGGEISKLEAEKKSLQQDLEASKTRVKDLEVQVTDLTNEKIKLNGEIASLNKRITDEEIAENSDERALKFCKENLKKISLGLKLYYADNKKYPKKLNEVFPNPKYLDLIPTCPAVLRDTYTSGYKLSKEGKTFVICCLGHNHRALRIKENYPAFDSEKGLEVERNAKEVVEE